MKLGTITWINVWFMSTFSYRRVEYNLRCIQWIYKDQAYTTQSLQMGFL